MTDSTSGSGTSKPADLRFIPNSFQTPNAYIDVVLPLLTPEEWKCLSVAIRRILGWYDRITSRQAEISLSQFMKCGLSRPAVVKAVDELCNFRLLERIGEPTDKGQCYRLLEGNEIDLTGLTRRLDDKKTEAIKRTAKARSTGGKSHLPGVVSRTNQQARKGGKSDLPNKHRDSIQTKDKDNIESRRDSAPKTRSKSVPNPEPSPAAATQPASRTKKTPSPASGVPPSPQGEKPTKKAAFSAAADAAQKQTPELKNAFATLTKGGIEAWNVEEIAREMSAAIRGIIQLHPATPLTVDDLRDFYLYWKTKPLGKDGNRPQPHQVRNNWLDFRIWQAKRFPERAVPLNGQEQATPQGSVPSQDIPAPATEEELAAVRQNARSLFGGKRK